MDKFLLIPWLNDSQFHISEIEFSWANLLIVAPPLPWPSTWSLENCNLIAWGVHGADMGRVSAAFASSSETTFMGTLNGSIAFALFHLHF